MKVLERRNDGDPRVVELTAQESVLTAMYRSLEDTGFTAMEAADMTVQVAIASDVVLTREFVQWMTDQSQPTVDAIMAMYEEWVTNG